MKDWSYFNKFEKYQDKYLPVMGEGDTQATQMVTAVVKLVYKYYNDGDVYDNTAYLTGWWNDLSSYANWLHRYCADVRIDEVLERIYTITTEDEYQDLLAILCELVFVPEYLKLKENLPKAGTIYKQDGPFQFVEYEKDEEEDYYEDEGYYEEW